MKIRYRPIKIEENKIVVRYWPNINLINVDIPCHYNPKVHEGVKDRDFYCSEVLRDNNQALILYPYYDREEDLKPERELENPVILYYTCYLEDKSILGGRDLSLINRIGVRTEDTLFWIPRENWIKL